MDVSILQVLFAFRQSSLRRADHSSRGVLPSVCVCACVSLSEIRCNSDLLSLQWVGKGSQTKKEEILRVSDIIFWQLQRTADVTHNYWFLGYLTVFSQRQTNALITTHFYAILNQRPTATKYTMSWRTIINKNNTYSSVKHSQASCRIGWFNGE